MSKKRNNWVPIAAAIGGVAGVLYLVNNQASVRRDAYRTGRDAAASAGINLPDWYASLLPEATYTRDETRTAMYGAEIARILSAFGSGLPATNIPNELDTVGGGRFGVQFRPTF